MEDPLTVREGTTYQRGEQNKNQELRVGQEPLQTGFYYAETCFLGRVIKLGECFQHALLANVQSSDILSEGYCKGSLI